MRPRVPTSFALGRARWTSGDHDATGATLRPPENQAHLDAIGKPTDPAALAEALRGLLRCAGESLPDDKLSGAVAAWLAGEQAGLSRDGTACAAQFSLAADLGAGTAVTACARVVLSQWLWYLGLFREAEGALPRAEEAVLPAVRQWRDLHLGRLWAAQGVYASAQEAFGAAAAGPSPLLSEHARLLQGECLEFRGLWEDAGQLYTALAKEATAPTARRLAHYWTRRVQECSRQYRAAFGTVAHYWGEDRQTQNGGGEGCPALLAGGTGRADDRNGRPGAVQVPHHGPGPRRMAVELGLRDAPPLAADRPIPEPAQCRELGRRRREVRTRHGPGPGGGLDHPEGHVPPEPLPRK